jgi:rhodanese-related sulfurtransferase
MREMTPLEFVALTKTGETPFLLDVREAWEVAIASVDGAVHIPMGDIPDRLAEIPRDREVVVMCKVGGRSQAVARFLETHGYPRVANLTGGILLWAGQVDPAVATY